MRENQTFKYDEILIIDLNNGWICLKGLLTLSLWAGGEFKSFSWKILQKSEEIFSDSKKNIKHETICEFKSSELQKHLL